MHTARYIATSGASLSHARALTALRSVGARHRGLLSAVSINTHGEGRLN